MSILGLDLSLTETGYCIFNDLNDKVIESGVIKSDRKKFTDEDELDRLLFIVGKIKDLIDKNDDIEHVVIEGFSFGSKGQALFQIAGLSYLVRNYLRDADVEYTLVPPTTLKKWVTKKGNAPKEVMILHTYKRWEESFENNNICDAYCLCRYYKENII